MTITVNGVAISDSEIAVEMQYHAAPTATEARTAAARALVVRELLTQEVRRLEFGGSGSSAGEAGELGADSPFDRLLAGHVPVPEPDEETCRRYYRTHRARFRTPELYEAHHILIAARPENSIAVERAKASAQSLITELEQRPQRFAELAASHSDCPSREAGGSLGQVSQREIAPELTTFLAELGEGQLCPVPVHSSHGFHVLRLDRRAAAAELPYEAVCERIAAYLTESVWRRAIGQYIGLLAGRAEIAGIEIQGWDTPLVQ